MSTRDSVYYWKCDRAYAFHSLLGHEDEASAIAASLRLVLDDYFQGGPYTLKPAGGQGNHITYLVSHRSRTFFLRLENGPEKDDYMEVESRLLDEVRAAGVPTPGVFHVDTTRSRVPYAWQLLEFMDVRDLNHFHKVGTLDQSRVFTRIGADIARWQSVRPSAYGPMMTSHLREQNSLRGLHPHYRDYFFLNWEKHLHFLVSKGFLANSESRRFQDVVRDHEGLLDLPGGCLVHKDLALWNILGTAKDITAYIDWDDSISGDPLDDMSLLGCFHGGDALAAVQAGYESVRPLPENFCPRFWLHLLRNMVVKAVIRVGAGYFDRQGGFFLLSAGGSGHDLQAFTRQRLEAGCQGLEKSKPLSEL